MAHETWSETTTAWRREHAALVAKFRPKYLAELERFAETLQPRFEAGELRGITDDDCDREMFGTGDRWRSPIWKLADLCREHFGIERTYKVGEVRARERDPVTAELILACSPSAEEVQLHVDDTASASSVAADAITWDVIAIARARGWYTPTEGEEPALESTRWAEEGAQP